MTIAPATFREYLLIGDLAGQGTSSETLCRVFAVTPTQVKGILQWRGLTPIHHPTERALRLRDHNWPRGRNAA